MSSMTSQPLDVEEQLPPRRLMDGGGSEQERRLLAAAGQDPLPDIAGARAAGVLQAALAALQEPAPAPIEGPGAAAAGKALLGSVLAGTVVAAVGLGALLLRPGPAVPAIVDAPALPALTPAATVVAAPSAPESLAPAAAIPQRSEPQPPAKARKAPAAASARRATAPARSRAEDGLAAELRAIESVQALLGWGQLPRAATELASYRRRFPAGELRVEADLLEIELAHAGGDGARAAQLARELLARPGTSGYRARLAPLLKDGSKGAAGDIPERR